MKHLIVNGDDFGYSPSMNAAIIHGHKNGILTSASLMPCGFAFEEAVEMARATASLSVGVHLCLLQGRPVLPASRIPLITDADGNFFNDPILAGLRFLLLKGAAEQIEDELRAQMSKFLATGFRPSHINTHMHQHAHPTVFPIVAKLGREHDIRWLRVPRESLTSQLWLDRRFFLQKLVRAIFFYSLSFGLRKKIQRAGFQAPDQIFGLLQTGHIDEAYWERVLTHLQEGVTEIYVHPGSDADPVLQRWQPGYNHAGESAALLSRRLKNLIEEFDVRLTYFEAANQRERTPLPPSYAGSLASADR